ncbi:MAG: triose-phosphate isomerase [Methanomassiliicoccales archaeon]
MTELRTPVIVVNFKTYAEVEGAKVLDVALACQEVSEETGRSIVICPPTVELSRVASGFKVPVFCQHVDAKNRGANTGWITPQGVVSAGAVGTLLNHSEHRLMMYDLKASIEACREAGLITIACADGPESAAIIAAFKPDFIAIEPPELIGGNVSVTDAKPEVISKGVDAVHDVSPEMPVLCGAGIKTGTDVRKALELGTMGVLLASGVVKSKDVKATLKDLVSKI